MGSHIVNHSVALKKNFAFVSLIYVYILLFLNVDKGSYYSWKTILYQIKVCDITGGVGPSVRSGGCENPPKKYEIIFEQPLTTRTSS